MSNSSVNTISNGRLLAHIDNNGLLRDLFLPKIRPASYMPKSLSKIGIRVAGSTSWVNSSDWQNKTKRNYNAPINNTVLVNDRLGVLLEIEVFVAQDSNIILRNIHVVNLWQNQRTISLFIHQQLMIDHPLSNDTARFLPDQGAVLYYGNQRAFVFGGMSDIGTKSDQHSIGQFGDGLDGTWMDAESGDLSGSNFASGQTDSTLRFSLTIGGLSSRRLYSWICTDDDVESAIDLSSKITVNEIIKQIERIVNQWKKWLSPAYKIVEKIQPSHRQVFINNLIQLKLSQDLESGAVVEAGKDGLVYCNIESAAYAAWPLMRLGYESEANLFFDFCESIITKNGFLASQYISNGTPGPISDKDMITVGATVLFVIAQNHTQTKDANKLSLYYENLIKPLADYVLGSIDGVNQRMSSQSSDKIIYTASLIIAGLNLAAELAELSKDEEKAVAWRTASEDVYVAIQEYIADHGIFESVSNPNIHAFYGCFMFGTAALDSQVMNIALKLIENNLKKDNNLYAESTGSSDTDYLGSLWMSQYFSEKLDSLSADSIIKSIAASREFGIMPSTWTQAELLNSLLDTTYRT